MLTTSCFAFPVNIIIVLSILFILFLIKTLPKTQKLWEALASKKCLLLATFAFFLAILLIQLLRTFLPHAADSKHLLSLLGFTCFNASPFLLVISTFLMITLVANHLQLWKMKWSFNKIRLLLFQFSSIIIIIALFGGFFDQQRYQMTVYKDFPSSLAIKQKKVPVTLPFTIQLKNIKTDYYESNILKNVESHLIINRNQKFYEKKIAVNSPLYFNGFDLYLQSYDKRKSTDPLFCHLIIIKDPWKNILKFAILGLILSALLMFIPTKIE